MIPFTPVNLALVLLLFLVTVKIALSIIKVVLYAKSKKAAEVETQSDEDRTSDAERACFGILKIDVDKKSSEGKKFNSMFEIADDEGNSEENETCDVTKLELEPPEPGTYFMLIYDKRGKRIFVPANFMQRVVAGDEELTAYLMHVLRMHKNCKVVVSDKPKDLDEEESA